MSREVYVSSEDIIVSTPLVSFRMSANEPVELSPRQAKAAVQFGARPVSGIAPSADDAPREDDVKDQIREAIQRILDEGKELSKTGVPKLLDVKEYAPDATPALRDEVWATFFEPQD